MFAKTTKKNVNSLNHVVPNKKCPGCDTQNLYYCAWGEIITKSPDPQPTQWGFICHDLLPVLHSAHGTGASAKNIFFRFIGFGRYKHNKATTVFTLVQYSLVKT